MSDKAKETAQERLERLRSMLESYEDLGWVYAANRVRMALLAAERRTEASPKPR